VRPFRLGQVFVLGLGPKLPSGLSPNNPNRMDSLKECVRAAEYNTWTIYVLHSPSTVMDLYLERLKIFAILAFIQRNDPACFFP
jgi:hypothetical protein